jgi:hypothetical protein
MWRGREKPHSIPHVYELSTPLPPSPLPGPSHYSQQSVFQFGHNIQGHHVAQAGPSAGQSLGTTSHQEELPLLFFEHAKRALEMYTTTF